MLNFHNLSNLSYSEESSPTDASTEDRYSDSLDEIIDSLDSINSDTNQLVSSSSVASSGDALSRSDIDFIKKGISDIYLLVFLFFFLFLILKFKQIIHKYFYNNTKEM